jgi:hypothetical protein
MYIKKVFLAGGNCPSTSTVVCYEGPPSWIDKERPDFKEKFFEVSNCHNKIRLHQTDLETDEDFILKLVKLKDELHSFIMYLT